MQEMQETRVWSLGRDDPLASEMATHSSILASKTPWTRGAGRLQSRESQSRTQLSMCACLSQIKAGCKESSHFLILRREHITTAVDQ